MSAFIIIPYYVITGDKEFNGRPLETFSDVASFLHKAMRDKIYELTKLAESAIDHPVWLLLGTLGAINKLYSTTSKLFYQWNSFNEPRKFQFYFNHGLHSWIVHLLVLYVFQEAPKIVDRTGFYNNSNDTTYTTVAEAVLADREYFFHEDNILYFHLLMVLLLLHHYYMTNTYFRL